MPGRRNCNMKETFTEQQAREKDAQDPLASLRERFHIPEHKGEPVLYFTGNSLGLQPREARDEVLRELEDWAQLGVKGHTQARKPWLPYHEFLAESLARLVGAAPEEVVAMNGLTVNLHLLLVSFYRPRGNRTKILCEGKAFPSDQYALRSQLRFHGLDPDQHLIEVMPDPETGLIDEEELVATIDEHREELATVLIGGVNYYSGQWLDMPRITDAGKRAGALVGWDLAHGIGNVPLELHRWGVDFATWCSYKYLNGGPGAVSGVYIHQRHHDAPSIPRLEGWWGHDKNSRFAMPEEFRPIPTAEAWQLSNAPVFAMAPLLASLRLFDEVGIPALRQKSEDLTSYLENILDQVAANTGVPLRIITPRHVECRGCQLSVIVPERGKQVYDYLSEQGVVADWREPDVIRLAPVPLYNNYQDIFRFGSLLTEALNQK